MSVRSHGEGGRHVDVSGVRRGSRRKEKNGEKKIRNTWSKFYILFYLDRICMHRWCTPPAMSNLYRCYRTVSTLDRQQWAEPQGEQQHSWFFAKSWKLFFFFEKKTKKVLYNSIIRICRFNWAHTHMSTGMSSPKRRIESDVMKL